MIEISKGKIGLVIQNENSQQEKFVKSVQPTRSAGRACRRHGEFGCLVLFMLFVFLRRPSIFRVLMQSTVNRLLVFRLQRNGRFRDQLSLHFRGRTWLQ